MNGALNAEGLFDEYEGPVAFEIGANPCRFDSPADIAQIYATFGIERDPVEDYEMISGHPKISILAMVGLGYYTGNHIEVSNDGYRQIVSSPGLEQGRILPFRRVG